MALPKIIKNFNVFDDGNHYLGKCSTATLPKLSRKTDEFRAGGMNAPIDADLGMEKLEFEWTIGGIAFDIISGFGKSTVDSRSLRFVGAIESDDAEGTQTLEITMRGRHREIDHGDAKPGETGETKITTSLSYYRAVLDGVEQIEIDILGFKETINGEDRLANRRSALGI